MPSSFTANKNIEQPAAGSYNDTWAVPVNNDWAIIDSALGGSTSIDVTGVSAGSYPLSIAQYQPPNIEFTGTISANLVYVVPANVGGFWSVKNGTTGTGSLAFSSGGVTSQTVPQGNRILVICDGTNMEIASSAQASANPTALVGLTPVDGLAGTFMRSDASPPIDQSIAPTWTGNHIFDGVVEFMGAVGIYVSASVAPGAVISGVSGAITAPTRSQGDSTNNVATTAFVADSFAPIASPVLTGTPKAPTAVAGTSTVQIATTQFVNPDSGSNANGYYRKNPDGSYDQWGSTSFRGSDPGTVTFPKAFTTLSSIAVSANILGVNSGTPGVPIETGYPTLTQFNFLSGGYGISWMAKGF